MASASPRIHPTALISAEARLADDVRVGAYTVIDGPVSIASGCIIRSHAHLVGPIEMGVNNDIGDGAVVGGNPQHLGFQGGESLIEIGEGNIFREHMTIHHAMPVGAGAGTGLTKIGNANLFMAGSHVGHDCRVANNGIFANGALLGGHVEVADRAFISGNAAVHQFCRVGRLAFLGGTSASSKDIPPFWMMQAVNRVYAVNVIGMRRAGMQSIEIQGVRKAFGLIYRERLTVSAAVSRIDAEWGHIPAVKELVEFIRTSKRGICGGHRFEANMEDAAA